MDFGFIEFLLSLLSRFLLDHILLFTVNQVFNVRFDELVVFLIFGFFSVFYNLFFLDLLIEVMSKDLLNLLFPANWLEGVVVVQVHVEAYLSHPFSVMICASWSWLGPSFNGAASTIGPSWTTTCGRGGKVVPTTYTSIWLIQIWHYSSMIWPNMIFVVR